MNTGTESKKTAALEGKQRANLSVVKSGGRKNATRRPAGKKRANLVVSIRRSSAGTISQDDLEIINLLRKRVRAAQEELEKEEARVRVMLQDGAAIEDGVHTARLVITVAVE